MLDADRWGVALVAATALHAGFQLTVSTVVYPALADVARADGPAADAAGTVWQPAHAAHSRRIGPLVGVVYPSLALALAGRLLAARDLPTVLAAGCSAAVVGLTAAVAAPLHGRLGSRPDPDLVHRLLAADRGRSAFAVGALAAALAGATGAARGGREVWR